MAVEDLTFTQSSSPINDPLTVGGTNVVLTVTNNGDDDLSGLGIYISPSTFSGPWTALPSSTPENDYMDVISFGDASHGGSPPGGLKIVQTEQAPASPVAVNAYIRSGYGDKLSNKAAVVPDLASGESVDVTIVVETPTSSPARNLYFDFRIE